MPLYPEIQVRLTGRDGNAFSVLGKVRKALKRSKVPPSELKAFFDEATDGDYDHLLQTCAKWVTIS